MYTRGQENVHSDCLSRLPLPETVTEAEPYEIVSTLQTVEKDFVTCTDIARHTDGDPDFVTLKQYIRTGCPDRINNSNLSKFKSVLPNLTITKGCIMFQNRVFIPPALRDRVLDLFHENHPGIVAMKAVSRSVIWYPGMDKDIHSLVSNCKICQSVRTLPPSSNISWPVPSRPWSRIHIDHFFYDNSVCLLVVDALTKYIEVEIVKSTSTTETIETLSCIFARNGLPDTLVSDNASCFTSFEFCSFLSRNGIKHITSPPYSPASNGQAERCVRTVKDLLKKNTTSCSLRYKLSKVLLQYRSVPHNSTQIAPSVALNNRKLITMRDRLNPQFCFNDDVSKKEIKVPQFELGSSVLALNLRGGQKWYTANIIERIGVNVYNVHVHDLNIVWTRHANQLVSIPESPRSNAVLNQPVVDVPTSVTPGRHSNHRI